MFETLSTSLSTSAPLPPPQVARRRAPSWGPGPSLRPLSGRWFLLFAFIYLYSFPYFDRLRSANEMPRILMAQEIVERGTCRIDARLGEMGSRFDTSRGVDGHLYSNKAPGPSFLAVPVYAVLKFFKVTSIKVSTWAFRVFVVTIPALFFLPLFYRLTGRFTLDEPARRTALVAYALGSSALPYSVLFLSHQLAAICLGGAFFAGVTLARDEARHPKVTALLVGALCAAAVLMDYQTLFISPLVGLYAFIRARRKLRNLLLFVLGALPFALALGAYHKFLFGSPFNTPLATSNEAATKSGFMGIIGPNWPAFKVLLLDPSNGLLLLMPWVVFAFVGFVAIFASRTSRRQAGAEAITCLLIVLVYLGVMGSLVPSYARAGWALGPRYLGASFPFLAWLAASGFAAAYRFFITRAVAQALVLASVVVFLAAASTFPHWPDGLRNPLFELSFRLVREGYAPHSIATALGLAGFPALAPLYLFSLVVTVGLIARGMRKAVLSGVLALLLTGGYFYGYYRMFPATGPYAEHAWRWVTRIWEPAPGPKIPFLKSTMAPAPPAAAPPAKPPAPPPPVAKPAPPVAPKAAPPPAAAPVPGAKVPPGAKAAPAPAPAAAPAPGAKVPPGSKAAPPPAPAPGAKTVPAGAKTAPPPARAPAPGAKVPAGAKAAPPPAPALAPGAKVPAGSKAAPGTTGRLPTGKAGPRTDGAGAGPRRPGVQHRQPARRQSPRPDRQRTRQQESGVPL